MAEIPPIKILPGAQEFAPADLPTFYADALLHIVPGRNVVKLIFNRQDPSFQKRNEFRIEPCVQVIMPVVGFMGAIPFFEQIIKTLIEHKAISEEELNKARTGLQALIQGLNPAGS